MIGKPIAEGMFTPFTLKDDIRVSRQLGQSTAQSASWVSKYWLPLIIFSGGFLVLAGIIINDKLKGNKDTHAKKI